MSQSLTPWESEWDRRPRSDFPKFNFAKSSAVNKQNICRRLTRFALSESSTTAKHNLSVSTLLYCWLSMCKMIVHPSIYDLYARQCFGRRLILHPLEKKTTYVPMYLLPLSPTVFTKLAYMFCSRFRTAPLRVSRRVKMTLIFSGNQVNVVWTFLSNFWQVRALARARFARHTEDLTMSWISIIRFTFTSVAFLLLTYSFGVSARTCPTAPISNGTTGNSTLEGSGSGSSNFVFAHFMVGNSFPYTVEDWTNDIQLALAHGIDAFALNVGTDSWQPDQVQNA